MSKPRSDALVLHLLFFFSGLAGLVYQVIWVREFGTVFGTTVHSAAIVTATFMGGLGLGGWLAGGLADRAHAQGRSLVRLYGLYETAIGLLAFLVAVALPALEPLSAWMSSYVVTAEGWHELSAASYLLRYAAALVLLLPITTLMGATLTLLVRHFVRSQPSQSGYRVGLLFGVNTAGAAIGALSVDFLLVPAMGLFGTQGLAVALNLGVGLAALRLARRETAPAAAPEPARVPAAAPARGGWSSPVVLVSIAVALSGFGAMGMEMLWFRQLSSLLGSARATFSLLLTVILVGIWLGATFAAALDRRFGRPLLVFAAGQTAFVASCLLLLATTGRETVAAPSLEAAHAAAGPIGRRLLDAWFQLRVILAVVGPPSVCLGFAYPMANAIVQRGEDRVGRRAGLLYLANTLGAVLGSLLAGFLLLPSLGLQRAALVLAAASASATIPLAVLALRRRPLPRVQPATAGALGAVLLLALLAWAGLADGDLARRTFGPTVRGERLLSFSEGLNETVVVSAAPDDSWRRLYTNGHSMSGTDLGSERYMRAFVHVPLLSTEDPRSLLVIGFGVGNTLHAATLHPSLERIELADLSRNVLEQAPAFERWNHGALRDERVAVFLNDGRQHLRMRPPESYDLVTLEPPPIRFAGVAALYSSEFYALAKSRLRPGGHVAQWLPAQQQTAPMLASMIRAFLDNFPDGVLLSGSGPELILLGRRGGPPRIDPARVLERLAADEDLRRDLERLDLARPSALVGCFAGGSEALWRVAADAPPVTDDLPLMEYAHAWLGRTEMPAAMFDVTQVGTWCPSCVDGAEGERLVPLLRPHLELLGALYESEGFRVREPGRGRAPGVVRVRGERAGHERALHAGFYLRTLYRAPD